MSTRLPPRLLTRAIEVLRAGSTTDRYGNTVPDWSNPQISAHHGWVSPLDTGENTTDRAGQRADARLFTQAGVDIDAGDRVRVIDEDRTYEVIGPVKTHHTMRGTHHIEVDLQWRNG